MPCHAERLRRPLIESGTLPVYALERLLAEFDALAVRLPREVAEEKTTIWGWSSERPLMDRNALRVYIDDGERRCPPERASCPPYAT
ncbi:hypothetical protein [Spongiactinospora sp. TRM90649]|uniref:hypothetical protein n=1 Tax=Spongiactinospora sp. TRM90649 TaxID=3031114 RepID=UPI0023F6CBA8|nr:hypothetical protein [Spongiactinospora sp. TRM90649]MDF5752374.1 hypothetical protein [Spongiactinospora sp. TRM90649]